MKMNMILLMMIFLIGCNGPQIKPQIRYDLSLTFNRCLVKCYSLMEVSDVQDYYCNILKNIPDTYPEFYIEDTDEKVGKYLKFVSGKYSVELCDEISGFSKSDYATKIKPKAVEIIQYYKDKEND